MIISRTPFRISFFGGGTDYPTYFQEFGGAVLSSSIDKYCYISCRQLPPFFEHKHRIVYSQMECINEIDEIKHPSVKQCMIHTAIQQGLEIHHDGDLPARSGLGSSSAFTVGLLNALNAFKGSYKSKKMLAEDAIFVETQRINEAVGFQDQIACAYGGFNLIEFQKNGEFVISPVLINKKRLKELNKNLLLFYTGIQRFASQIAQKVIGNIANKKDDLNTMKGLVYDALNILQDSSKDLRDFGAMLDLTWRLKRGLSSEVSNDTIDTWYAKAKSAGALGGKILGAGGGGFLLFYVEEEFQASVRASLTDLLEIDFEFENLGSQIIFYNN